MTTSSPRYKTFIIPGKSPACPLGGDIIQSFTERSKTSKTILIPSSRINFTWTVYYGLHKMHPTVHIANIYLLSLSLLEIIYSVSQSQPILQLTLLSMFKHREGIAKGTEIMQF